MRIFKTIVIQEKAICGEKNKACDGLHAG